MPDINYIPKIFFNSAQSNGITEFMNYADIPDYLNFGSIEYESESPLSKTIYLTHDANQTIENVGFFLQTYQGERPATALSENKEPFSFDSTSSDLVVKFDHNTILHNVQFPIQSLSAIQTSRQINSDIGISVAHARFPGDIVLVSPTKGHDSRIYITEYSTADQVLGFDKHNLDPIATGYIDSWGFIDSTNVTDSFANTSNIMDLNELLLWGDEGYGLKIGQVGQMHTFSSSIGYDNNNPIVMNWGEGDNGSSIHPFVSGVTGEIETTLELILPPDSLFEYNIGFRQISLGVVFTYY